MSQRIKVIRAEGLWAPRLGCEGVLVVPRGKSAGRYPFAGLGKNEVVIRLDSDPLHETWHHGSPEYTCVINKNDIEFLP